MEILQLKKDGLSVSAISRITGADRKTVRKVVDREGAPLPRRRRGGVQRGHKLEAHAEYLDGRMAQGVYNAVVLFEELRGRGYSGGMTVVRQYIRPFRPKVTGYATLRFETKPGEQAQVDFMEVRLHLGEGRSVLLHMTVYCLAYSRRLAAVFLPDESRVQFLRGLDQCFRITGGVPDSVLSDNLRAAVIGRDEHGKPIFAPEYLEFARHYGFTPRACRPYRAQTKGKVERPVRYLRDNFLPRLTEEDAAVGLDRLNERLRWWLDTIADVREHGTTHERPIDRWLRDEAAALQPLPAYPYGLDEIEMRRVSRDGFVEWKTCRYAVPWQLAGRDVITRESPDSWLTVEFDGVQRARYAVSRLRHQTFERAEYRAGLAEATLARHGIDLGNPPIVDERSPKDYEILANGGGQ